MLRLPSIGVYRNGKRTDFFVYVFDLGKTKDRKAVLTGRYRSKRPSPQKWSQLLKALKVRTYKKKDDNNK